MDGLLGLLDKPAGAMVASTAIVFGVQRLVPTMDTTWYKQITKPKWTPPNYVFPLVWIPLKLMQSAALSLVWRARGGATPTELALALGAFGAHMFLGNWWNVVFFGRKDMKGSLKWMYTFWASIAATAAAFKPVSPLAAGLMLPTLVWVTIATKLNIDIVALNPNHKAE